MDDPAEGLRAPWIKNYNFNVGLKVADLINPTTRRWDVQVLEENFVPGDVELISRKQPVLSREDFYTWRFNKSGQLTVKSAYWLACDLKTKARHPEVLALPSLNPLKQCMWKVATVPKIIIFLWKAFCNALPVASSLSRRGVKADERCQACGSEGEDIIHVLFACHVARQTWTLSDIPSPQQVFHPSSVFENMSYLLSLAKNKSGAQENKRAWPWILWRLWKSRNEFLFEGTRRLAPEIAATAKTDSEEWFSAQAVDKEMERDHQVGRLKARANWEPPTDGWLMCNIAFD